ncbi:chromosomal replication initiator protein DnaA [Gammaproteobacteria bacterium]|uniref:chromosomal replication initiator protein DnaA n=1 Tax=Wenyingzhuangia sp. TaxID=1964193 RepID=UPI002319B686|nr:chromosomal replication initiator protein DnaA [SAR86 cluster bacterium]MDA9140448.1 chromosomal replication initiator protein DnaA [Gammaproteobacteria bacterium]MDA9204919.1 chromosomal replication initiator protein DnaA [Gammaproteobacteria bacterium]MDA9800675.1 chromosomal replication initiator protein DnaA [Gammaproteobacteria bacterium]MDA9936206.1 chromosomal replication initiator protein DnaA [Gammaproteobacteria bacterium]
MKFWSECTEKLETKLSQEEFNTWIKPLRANINKNELEISAPNDFVLTYVKENLGQIIENLVNKSDESLSVKFKTLDKSTFVEKLNVAEVNTPGLVKHFTFNTFVEGKSNHMALAAAKQVAANPKGDYNPLFIYGGVGLGKTHLMHAVGNEILNSSTSKRIVYVHSEKFVADMVKALQLGAMSEFKEFYRNADALLIDDIQFFAGKEQSQEEFFHTFNALLDRNHQMILTCDKYPKEIDGLEERLKSRLGWGLPVIIEPPELETRAAVLLSKANSMGVSLPNDCAIYIAQRIRSNIRELEGALKRVVANSRFADQEIDIPFVKEALKDLFVISAKMVSIDNIQKTVAEYYNIKLSDLLSKRRSRSITRPRQLAMSLTKELTNHSLPEIGEAFNGRDHTTVLHACSKIKELRKEIPSLEEDYRNLNRTLTN